MSDILFRGRMIASGSKAAITFFLVSDKDGFTGMWRKLSKVKVYSFRNGDIPRRAKGKIKEIDRWNMPGHYSYTPTEEETAPGVLGLYIECEGCMTVTGQIEYFPAAVSPSLNTP